MLIVSSVIPGLDRPDGYAPRLFHFIEKLSSHFSVNLLLVTQADSLPSISLPLPIRRVWELAVGENPLIGNSVRSEILRLGHYLFDPLPFYCHPRRVPLLESIVEDIDPRVVVLHLPPLAYLERHIRREIPRVFLLEEDASAILEQEPMAGGVRTQLTRSTEKVRNTRYLRRAANRSEFLVVISDNEKTRLSRVVNTEKISVIEHGIDCEYFAPHQTGDGALPNITIDVGIFGRLTQPRNWDGAMSVLRPHLHQRSSTDSEHWRWGLVGEGGDRLASDLGKENFVIAGYVPDVRPYYQATKVVLVPAKQGSGVKSTVLQAWAMARPVVATTFALRGLPAIEGQNVMIRDTPQEILQAAEILLQEPALANRLGMEGRRTVEQHRDIRRLAQNFADLCVRASSN